MTEATSRFSKKRALEVLDAKAARIAKECNFKRHLGWRQIDPSGRSDDLIARAVEYGRMRAYEDFAVSAEEGFRFETTGGQQ